MPIGRLGDSTRDPTREARLLLGSRRAGRWVELAALVKAQGSGIDKNVRVRAASRADYAPLLDLLASDGYEAVREAVAANPNVSAETLRHLADVGDFRILMALAGNKATPADVMERLLRFDEGLRELTVEETRAVAAVSDGRGRASRTATSGLQLAERLRTTPDDPSLPDEPGIPTKYSTEAGVYVTDAFPAAYFSLLSEEILRGRLVLRADLDEATRLTLLDKGIMAHDVVTLLQKEGMASPAVFRRGVEAVIADRSTAASYLLLAAAADGELARRLTTREIRALVDCPRDRGMRGELKGVAARIPATPRELVDRMSPMERASWPGLRPSKAAAMARDLRRHAMMGWGVALTLARNPRLPPEGLVSLADYPLEQVRLAVVARADAPDEALAAVAREGGRAAVKAREVLAARGGEAEKARNRTRREALRRLRWAHRGVAEPAPRGRPRKARGASKPA